MANYLPTFVISYSDSSFTNPHQVVLPDDPPDCTGDFTHMGAKYWGFETSRHKATQLSDAENSFRYDHNAYHWIRIGLKQLSVVEKVTVSTKWFTGNQVPEIAIELVKDHQTTEVVSRSKLDPDKEHTFEISATEATECLVRCFHEGGIARINLFGETGTQKESGNLLEEAQITHVSNEHYGHPKDAVSGDRSVDYMLGWESARTGFGESALFHLSEPAVINEIVVDTYLHRLNAPLSCHVFALLADNDTDIEQCMKMRPQWSVRFNDGTVVIPEKFKEYMSSNSYLKEPTESPDQFTIELHQADNSPWHPLVSFGRLRPDSWHAFKEIEHRDAVSHILYMHYPNGGIHGLKVFGTTAS